MVGLLLFSGAQADGDSPRDSMALGLDGGTAVFKINLGTGVEEVASDSEIMLNKPNTVKITRNEKYGRNNFIYQC